MDVIGLRKIIEVTGIIKTLEITEEIVEIVRDIIMIMVVVEEPHHVIVIIIVVVDQEEEGVNIMNDEEVTLRMDHENDTLEARIEEKLGDMIVVTEIEIIEKEGLIMTGNTGTILQGNTLYF
jgi:hypothetical protein